MRAGGLKTVMNRRGSFSPPPAMPALPERSGSATLAGFIAVQPLHERPPMIRKAFKMSVHADAHAEYERRHRPIWRELEETLVAHGVHRYSIFLDPQTSELFGCAEIESEERWQAIAQTAVCLRWWKYMRDLMPTNPDHSPKSIELHEVFHIEKP